MGNNATRARIDERREVVARLRLRGASIREIAKHCRQMGLARSLSTIHKDLRAIQEDWRSHARQDIATHKARQLAELNELRRAAWQSKDYRLALSVLREEIALLGTDAPIKILWEQELRQQGIPAGDLFERMVQFAETELTNGRQTAG